MKSVTTVLFFLALSASLLAQNDSIRRTIQPKPAYSAKNWQSMNLHFGLNYTNTEGVFKEYIKTQFALNFGVEFHNRHIYAINVTIRPASLKKTFTNKNHVWKADTTINLSSPQSIFGYQFWASKHVALYFVGALTIHSLSAGESQNNNERPNKPKPWTIASFAPSTGFYLDVRRQQLEPHGGYRDHYFRFKFMANPVNFSTIVDGVLYDTGVGYSF